MSGRFATLLALGEPSLGSMLVALADELGDVDMDAAHGRLGLLVEELDESVRDPALQLDQLGERVAETFEVTREGHRMTDIEDLRPDAVLDTHAGEELVVASLVAAVAQGRGWPVRVVIGKQHAVIGHLELDAPLVVSPRHYGRLIDARDLDDDTLAWCCTHEVAAAILDRIDARAARYGQRELIYRARELVLALPLGEREMSARKVELERARSAWN